MNARERGFLLLTSHLGDETRKPLTVAQLRQLSARAGSMERPVTDRELNEDDLVHIGYSREAAQRILQLFSENDRLDWYIGRGRKKGLLPDHQSFALLSGEAAPPWTGAPGLPLGKRRCDLVV